MAAETGLLIDGRVYETPDLMTFDLDECQVLYDYSGLTLEDFVPLDGESDDDHMGRIDRLMRHPGFKKTLLHVAYKRGNPKLPDGKVRDLVAAANWLTPFTTLGEPEPEDDAVPPASTSEPDGSSPKSSLESNSSPETSSGSGGTGSASGGDGPDGTQAGTGALRSVTSAISPQEISAA